MCVCVYKANIYICVYKATRCAPWGWDRFLRSKATSLKGSLHAGFVSERSRLAAWACRKIAHSRASAREF